MPYFNAKARKIFRDANGDTAKAGPLARWARDTHAAVPTNAVAKRFGVIVARHSGEILAHTARQGVDGENSRHYVTRVTHDEHRRDVADTEIGLAMATLRHHTGHHLLHVTYWDACTGSAPTGSHDIHPDRYIDIRIHLSQPGADVTPIVEYAGTGSDDDGEYLDLCDGTRLRRNTRGGWYQPGWSKYSDPDTHAEAAATRGLPNDNW